MQYRSRLRTTGRPRMASVHTCKIKRVRDPGWYGDDWEALSQHMRLKRGYRCDECNDRYPPPFHHLLHVHHIVPLPRGTNHESNLQVLCIDCHSKEHGRKLGTITEKQKTAAQRTRTKR